MSPSIKLGLLSLVSAAAAVPHSGGGGHSRFHSSGGYGGHGTGLPGTGNPAPYPTGGWGGSHNHTHHGPTGTGRKTTTLLHTQHSTETVVSTIYATRPGEGSGGNGASSAGALGGASSAAVCGPATVTVTATNKVTVTVPAGGDTASSAAGSYVAGSSAAASSTAQAVEVPSSSSKAQPASPSTGGGYVSPPPAAASSAASSAVIEKVPSVSVSLDHKQPTYVAPSSKAATSAAPASSKAASSAASSAAKPSSTGSSSSGGNYSGAKRGVGYTSSSYLSKFTSQAIGWVYNWESIPKGTVGSGQQFIPTLHPLKYSADFASNVKGAKNLFTFNEPDAPDQANFAPTEANCGNYWTNIVEPIITANPSMTIVAPSVTNGNMTDVDANGKVTLNSGKQGAPMGLYWLELFKKACPKAASAWKEINIHYYDVWEQGKTIERFQGYYNLAAELNPGKKIWVTELGMAKGSEANAGDFLPLATKFLDSQTNCAGYSWFKADVGQSDWLMKSGGDLSDLGKTYNGA